MARNRWTNYVGISGRFAPESVDELDWNAWTIRVGIRTFQALGFSGGDVTRVPASTQQYR